jgi:hypothetical protein
LLGKERRNMMLTMREAYERAKRLRENPDEAVGVEYRISSFHNKPCNVYIAHLGHFDGWNWESCLQAAAGEVIGMPLPPDEEPEYIAQQKPKEG